jgi:hypothetical protein
MKNHLSNGAVPEPDPPIPGVRTPIDAGELEEEYLPPSYAAILEAWQALPFTERLARWEVLDALEPVEHRGRYMPLAPADENDNDETTRRPTDLLALFDMEPYQHPSTVLGGRYQLRRRIGGDLNTETWLAADADMQAYLVKIWRYRNGKPNEAACALWNNELRMLYRLGSSRNAERSLLVLREAGIDLELGAFVMVLYGENSGYTRLSEALTERAAHPWAMLHTLRTSPLARSDIWAALSRVAEGIDSLHVQHVIHRCVAAESVFFDPSRGLDSWRLGGFEWSVRLGAAALGFERFLAWACPPETAAGKVGFTFDTDWFAFGMLAVRCFYDLEHLGQTEKASYRHNEVLRTIHQNTGNVLTELEKDLLIRLIEVEPSDRLTRGQEVLSRLQRLRRVLAASAGHERDTAPLVVAFNPAIVALGEGLQEEAGFVPNPNDTDEPYSSESPLHRAELKNFLREKLRDVRLYSDRQGQRFVLVGQPGVTLFVGPYRDDFERKETWDVAFIHEVGQLRTTAPEFCRDLRDVRLLVVEKREVEKNLNRRSWTEFLPAKGVTKRRELDRFHDFLRCTNMIELLMSCAEIFRYQVIERSDIGGVEKVILKEAPRLRRFPKFCHIEGGLLALLERERDSGKPNWEKVLLTQEENLHLRGVEGPDFWEIEDIDPDTERVTLTRSRNAEGRLGVPAPEIGFIRTFGLNGQVRLIARRKEAIERLDQHSYLLRAIAQPGSVTMDTGIVTDAYVLPIEEVDESKRAVIQDIERVRPIYALQGPPGTGKTTLVAYKLRRLFEDDPLAQVLVTAQAHSAVDVLRGKVNNEAFKNVSAENQPLAIRLGARVDSSQDPDQDSLEQVTDKQLRATRDVLRALGTRTPLQDRWLSLLESKFMTGADRREDAFFQDFDQLVKRSANITYCTTSAGDLAELAQSSQAFDWSFDWVIVEEAGRVHGFDLALPLQTGHRWLLLGDPEQLEPFREDKFREALQDLDRTVRDLNALPDRPFLDQAWLQRWRDQPSAEERTSFVEYAQRWLLTFSGIFDMLRLRIHSEERLTTDEPIGAKAGRLIRQWRMHPDIGDLISHVFYDDDVRNGTMLQTGHPDPKCCHQLRLRGLNGEHSLAGRAIIWIDTPWMGNDPLFKEAGPLQHQPRYTNVQEAKLVEFFLRRLELIEKPEKPQEIVVLTPYSRQVGFLNNRLRNLSPPFGCRPVPLIGRTGTTSRWAHTVDGFQGNQADIVIVSLVRNNLREDPDSMGFLQNPKRLNVLLSRAEKLLVLVGSWDFIERQVKDVKLDYPDDRHWHWAKTLAVLRELFVTKRALRLPVHNFFPEMFQ